MKLNFEDVYADLVREAEAATRKDATMSRYDVVRYLSNRYGGYIGCLLPLVDKLYADGFVWE